MQTIHPRTTSFVLVCANERAPDAPKASCGKARGEELKDWLKERLAAEGLKGKARAIKTGCLDVCNKAGVAVTLTSASGGPGRSWVVDPVTDREQLFQELKQLLLQEG
jgi:hypothetical protein